MTQTFTLSKSNLKPEDVKLNEFGDHVVLKSAVATLDIKVSEILHPEDYIDAHFNIIANTELNLSDDFWKNVNRANDKIINIGEEGKLERQLDAIQWAFRKEIEHQEMVLANPEPPSTPLPNSEPKPEPVHTTAPEPIKTTPVQPSAAPKDGLEKMIYDVALQGLRSRDSLDVIEQTIKHKLDGWGIVPGQVEITVKKPNVDPVKVKGQHKQFELILKTLAAGCNLWLAGPAGSGKTTVVREAAKALGLTFASKSISAQTGVHEFFGYRNAAGDYVRTSYRDLYEFGGIFLLDESDAGNPNVIAAMNQSMENEEMDFPDGMVKKHEDFIVVAAGNTYGGGATTQYVGRNKIDAATLDRFVFITFDYDEKFENQLAMNKDWAKKVQKYRKRAEEKKIKTIISPRASINGSKLLAQGISEDMVTEMVIYKGMTPDEKSLLGKL